MRGKAAIVTGGGASGIGAACATTLAREGELEFDDDAIASEGDDNGAYLQAWVWVDFGGTNFDKHQSVGLSSRI